MLQVDDSIELLVGLGNPGPKYDRTRHNIGFMALDRLAAAEGLSWRGRGRGQEAVWHAGGRRVILLKPLTFMNLSGHAIVDTLRYYSLNIPALVVITDDVALPLGAMRMRSKGSAGGQNGLKNIIEQLGTQEFWRLRLGVGGRKHPGMDLTSHVLGKFTPSEMPKVNRQLEDAEVYLRDILKDGPTLAMSRHNRTALPEDDEKSSGPAAAQGGSAP